MPVSSQAPSLADIEAIARDAWARLPAEFTHHLLAVVFRVEEFAEDDVLRDLGIDSPYDLTGLYSGRPLGDKASAGTGDMPDMIHLYRVPILLEWIESGEDLTHLVRHVLIHEIGHHFGLSDDDMHAIENAPV